MDLRQLRYFVAVAEKGSFTKAAELLGIAQPSLGVQVRKLEEQFQVQLFTRASNGVQMTEAGRFLLRHAIELLDDASNLQREMRGLAEKPNADVALGITSSLAEALLIPIMDRCGKVLPQVRLSVTEEMTQTLLDLLQHGKLDIAIGYRVPQSRGVTSLSVATEGVSLLTLPTPQFASMSHIPFAALAGYPLILPRRPHGLRVLAEATAARENVDLNIVFEMQSVGAMLRLAQHGYGGTLVANTVAGSYASSRQLICLPIVDPVPQSEICIFYADGKALNRSEQRVLNLLRDICVANFAPDRGKVGTKAA